MRAVRAARTLVALAVLASPACRPAPRSSPAGSVPPATASPAKTNLLVVLIDTLRADHLECYGYSRHTSPNIDRLARESVLFENAFSHAPWTMASVASLFTSLEPKDHGIADWKQPLDDKLLTLAEHLRAQGYRTEGYVSHGVLSPLYKFNQGFEVYDASVVEGRMPREISTAKEITDLALAAVERPMREPWFLWVHYFDPHDAYLLHKGFDFGGRPIDRYDSEIAYTDQQLGRLLDALRARGVLEHTIVVFLADHGEGFGAHHMLYHSTTLYDELLHVPLLIRAPGLAPGRVRDVVGVIDIAPTVLGLLGLPAPEPFRGRRLRVANGRFEPGQDGVVVAETHREVDLRGVRAGRWKLIEDRAGGGRKLFDLEQDPGEQKNVRKSHPDIAERLEALLDAHYAGGSTSAPRIELPADLEQRLRSLGYLK